MVFPARLPQALGACPGAFRLPGNLGGWGGYVWRVHGCGEGGVAATSTMVAEVFFGGRAWESR